MYFRVFITALAAGALTCGLAQGQDNQSQPASSQNTSAAATSAPAATPQAQSTAPKVPLPHKTKGKKSSGKHSKQAQNPIADVDSKQPDKVLFDRAQDAIQHHKYDVARLSLQTLINTYPDSEYVARAKLAIADSWYDEGGTAALAQAESEYKDFITFFPQMAEAAEAQMKIGNIHYKQMEKADRDPTHARRAEDEYRQVILQFPDSPLVPEAKRRLLEVQEILADREYQIGHFYYLRDSFPAAIARLKSLADTYPLYSGVDDALYDLGQCYEKEIALVRRSKASEALKGMLIKGYTVEAQKAYDRIVSRYPLADRAKDAKERLEALKLPVPHATDAAIAQNKAEIASRHSAGTMDRLMENFRKAPDVSAAATIGEPTLVDPKQASAPDLVRGTDSSMGKPAAGENKVTAEPTTPGAAPPESAPVPRSDTGTAANTANPSSGTSDAPEMKNDLPPQPGAENDAAGAKAPSQVNDAAPVSSSDGQQPAAASAGSSQPASSTNSNTESSSRQKKKKRFGIF